MILHPSRGVKIMSLYRFLKGKYRLTTILAHAYKEQAYSKRISLGTKDALAISKSERPIGQTPQVIVNIHDGLLRSGGLTDRLKGICTLYTFAKTHNYDFKIFFVHPFQLEKYLLPNTYDWSIEESSIIYDLNKTAIYTWETESLASMFFRSNMDKPQLHVSCNSGECFPVYSEVFNELFKPSQLLSNALESHIEKLGGTGEYISISLRFQNLLGEFKEANSVALNDEKRESLIDSCLSAINSIKLKHPEIEKILITSDSNLFREIATAKFPYLYTFIIKDEVGHLDYSGAGKSKELTAFLDMFLISKASKAYQIRNIDMYNSDFPNMAARINNIPYEMILIE